MCLHQKGFDVDHSGASEPNAREGNMEEQNGEGGGVREACAVHFEKITVVLRGG